MRLTTMGLPVGLLMEPMGLLSGNKVLDKTDGALDDALDDNGRVLEENEDSGGGLQTSIKPLKHRVRPPNRLMVMGPMALRPMETGSEGSGGGPPKRHFYSLSLSNDGLLSSAAVLTA